MLNLVNIDKNKLSIITLFIMIILIAQPLYYPSVINVKENPEQTSSQKIFSTPKSKTYSILSQPKVKLGKIETSAFINSSSYPGLWHNTNYNYRIKIQINETSGLSRTSWPVDIYVIFNPWANRQGITVMDETGNNVTFQIWNTTGNTTHMASATITILVDIPAYGSETYYIYYDTDPVGTPTFPTEVTLSISTDATTGEPIYTIVGASYSKVVLAPGIQLGAKYIYSGGKIVEIDESSTSLNLYTPPINELGVSQEATLYNPLGIANMTNQPADRYVDPTTQNGPIFILYHVINAPIINSTSATVALANITYRFYSWGWISEAKVKWLTNQTNTDYWVAIYSFDQDDGSDVVYDRVATSDGKTYVLGEGLPQTYSSVDYDWGRANLTNSLRAFVTPTLTTNHIYTVRVDWSGYVDLDLFVYSETGLLLEGYDNIWDKIDGFVTTQDYTESEQVKATKSESWVIVVLAYLSEGDSATFTVSLIDENTSTTIATFTGSFLPQDFVYSSRYDAYCNYYDSSYPDTIDTLKEGNVNYVVGGYAKRYFADDELVPFVIDMPLQYGDDYYIRVGWDLTNAIVHYHIFLPDGTPWISDTSGLAPPLNRTLYPTTPGRYVVLIHYYDGSYYDADDQSAYDDITTELYFEPPFAETEDYYASNNTWSWIAFYHHYYNRSIGFINISTTMSLPISPGSSIDLYWGNKGEGPSGDEDYILWAIRLMNISPTSGSYIQLKYGVVLAGTNSSQEIAYFADRLRSPLVYSIYPTERFTLQLTVNVLDKVGGSVVGARVQLYNRTSGTLVYSADTDANGIAVLDVYRYNNYTLNITLISANNAYFIIQYKDYSVIPYNQFSLSETYQFSTLIRVTIQCNDTANRYLQSAIVRFNGTLAYEYTDLTGKIDVYIPAGVWNLTIGYKFDYDTYNLTYTDLTPVQNISGFDITNVKWAVINISTDVEWILIDLDAAAPPPLSLELREGSYTYNVYWGEYVYLKIATVSLGTLVDADNNVTWRIVYADTGLDVPGFSIQKMSLVSLGIYDLNLSSGLLPAGYTYNLIIDVNTTTIGGKVYFIDASGNVYQRPQPLIITINVKPRPTSIVLDSITSSIYWDEPFYVKVYYVDALTNTHILGGTAKIILDGPATLELNLTPISDYYELEIGSFNYPTGAYTITIILEKGNYSQAVYTTLLIVDDRPTEIFTQQYVEIPWSTTNYNVTIWYNDSRRSSLVYDATGTYAVYDAETQALLIQGTLYLGPNGYILSIPILNLGIGTYTIVITLSRQYYETKTISIALIINPRSTFATTNTTLIETLWNQSKGLLVSYYDREFDTPQKIIGATATFKVFPLGNTTVLYTGILVPYGSDYLLNINFTRAIGIGSFRIVIAVFKENYTSQQLEVDLVVDPIPTILIASTSTVNVEWGQSINITFTYMRTDTHEGISNSTEKHYVLSINGTTVVSGTLIELGDGYYRIFLNTTSFINSTWPVLGTYILEVYLWKEYHESQTIVIPVTISEASTIGFAQPANISAVWGENKTLLIYYNRTRDNKFIGGATIEYSVTPDVPSGAIVIQYGEPYALLVYTNKLRVGTYWINITISKLFYQSKQIIVRLDVDAIPTFMVYSFRSITIEYSETVTLDVWYMSTFGGVESPIIGATITYVILLSNNTVARGSLIYNSTKNAYELVFNSTQIASLIQNLELPAVFNIYLNATKESYAPQTNKVVTITVEPIATTTIVSKTDIVTEWGKDEYIGITILRNKTLEPVKNVSLFLTGLPNGSWEILEDQSGYILYVNTSMLEYTNRSYVVTIEPHKKYYDIRTITLSITVTKVKIDIVVRTDIPKSVYRTPIIGEHSHTYIVLSIIHNKTIVEEAEVYAVIRSNDAGVSDNITGKPTGKLGEYQIDIDWGQYPPGYKYTIEIGIKAVKVYNKWVTLEKIEYAEQTYIVSMDYVFGTTKIVIGGNTYYIPNLIYYPLVSVVFLAVIALSIWAYLYITTPWQVREVDKILKLLEKGIYTYEAPTREEYAIELISSELK